MEFDGHLSHMWSSPGHSSSQSLTEGDFGMRDVLAGGEQLPASFQAVTFLPPVNTLKYLHLYARKTRQSITPRHILGAWK